MKQLSGLDAAFIHQDSRRTPMHITAVLIYDVGASAEWTIQRADLSELLTSNLEQFPLFRRRLHRVPLDVDTPYWVDVPNPDFSEHLSEISFDSGGGWHGFQLLLTQLHNRRMDLSRPLWELCLIHELNDLPDFPSCCQAVVLKFHHSVIDGMSLAAMIDALHRDSTPARDGGAKKSTAPTYTDMWARLNFNTMDRQIKFAGTMARLMPGLMRASRSRKEFGDLPPVLSTRVRFNDRIGTTRVTGFVVWPRKMIVAIRQAVRRVTFNDIALSIVAGALREYLGFYQQLPAESLVCGVPISLRGAASKQGGNLYATMRVGLATCVPDPVERLRLVHRYAVAGKKQINALGTGTIMDISDSLNPNILAGGIRAMAEASSIADLPVPFHTMLSNVPGPRAALRLGEAKLLVPLGFGPVRDNLGLFHTVSDSPHRVSLSFTACARLMPDAEFYQECLHNACTDLYEGAMVL